MGGACGPNGEWTSALKSLIIKLTERRFLRNPMHKYKNENEMDVNKIDLKARSWTNSINYF